MSRAAQPPASWDIFFSPSLHPGPHPWPARGHRLDRAMGELRAARVVARGSRRDILARARNACDLVELHISTPAQAPGDGPPVPGGLARIHATVAGSPRASPSVIGPRPCGSGGWRTISPMSPNHKTPQVLDYERLAASAASKLYIMILIGPEKPHAEIACSAHRRRERASHASAAHPITPSPTRWAPSTAPSSTGWSEPGPPSLMVEGPSPRPEGPAREARMTGQAEGHGLGPVERHRLAHDPPNHLEPGGLGKALDRRSLGGHVQPPQANERAALLRVPHAG